MFASAFTLVTFAIATLSSVTALPAHPAHERVALARRSKPADWPDALLEDYDVYHTRYNALHCKDKHDTKFFDTCCTPMTKGQKLSSRPDECDPTKKATSTHVSTSTKKTTSSTKKANPTPPASGFDHKGGFGTFFFQNGGAGACGKKHPDSFPLVALTKSFYGSFNRASSNCGRHVLIRNTANGKTVTAVVADACPDCRNANSLDMSTGAYDKIGARSTGMLKIEWKFID